MTRSSVSRLAAFAMVLSAAMGCSSSGSTAADAAADRVFADVPVVTDAGAPGVDRGTLDDVSSTTDTATSTDDAVAADDVPVATMDAGNDGCSAACPLLVACEGAIVGSVDECLAVCSFAPPSCAACVLAACTTCGPACDACFFANCTGVPPVDGGPSDDTLAGCRSSS